MVIQNTEHKIPKWQNVISSHTEQSIVFGYLLNRLPDPDPDDFEYWKRVFAMHSGLNLMVYCFVIQKRNK